MVTQDNTAVNQESTNQPENNISVLQQDLEKLIHKDDTPAQTHMLTLSVLTCVEMISQAALDRRAAIQNELSVGLGLFFEAGGTAGDAKGMLQQVYARSGYDCHDSGGLDYTTINRRINASAKLYDFIGFDQIKNWVGNAVERQMVVAIVEGIKPANLHSIDRVMAFVGKPRTKPPAEPEVAAVKAEGKKEDKKEEHHVAVYRLTTAHLKLEIPKEDVSPQELMDMAAKLISLAQKVQKEQAKLTKEHAPAPAPEPAPETAVEQHEQEEEEVTA